MRNLETNSRFQADGRQIGALLMVLGFCAIIQPLANITKGIGPDGTTFEKVGDKPDIWGLVGAFCLFINGVFAAVIGYMATVHDWSHKYLTMFLIVIIQTAFIPYITNMSTVGKASRMSPEQNPLVPWAYQPSEADVRFVGSMGIISVFAYGFGFVGSFAFMAFSLQAYNVGKPEDRDGSYYKGRLGFYSCMLFIAGLAQLMLGAYSNENFGSGTLESGPIQAGVFTVIYPGISVFIGLLQCVNGIWGVARAFGLFAGPQDFVFQLSIMLQWILVLCLQDITQIAYPPKGQLVPAAPTLAAMSLGVNIMPAFLDHKMRTVPETIPDNYYCPSASDLETREATITTTKNGNNVEDTEVQSAEEVAV